MGNYKLSSKASEDIVNLFEYGIKNFGLIQANNYLNNLTDSLIELSERPELDRKTTLYWGLNYYLYNAHVIFFNRLENQLFVVRVLGKRMDFIRHL